MRRTVLIVIALAALTVSGVSIALAAASNAALTTSSPVSSFASPAVTPAAKPAVPVPPVITSLSRYNAAPGTQITISGSGFGIQKRDSIVWFNGVSAKFNSWDDTQIVFTVPSGVAAGYVGIQNDAGCSNGFYFIPFESPIITSISANTGAVGDSITITGQLFGATQGSGYVSFNGTPGNVVQWSDTQIVVSVPEGAADGYVGVVQNELSSNGMLFTPYYQPAVSSVSTRYALVGDTVTISGSYFGSTPSEIVLNGVRYAADSWSDTEATFTVPDGAASGYCGVVRNGVASNGVYLFVAPRITGASTWWATPGSSVTVTGVGFGDAAGSPFRLLLGGTQIAADSWSNTAVTFTVPAGATDCYIGFTDAQGAATSNGYWLQITTRATITSVSSADVETGAQFTVTGTDFGAPGSGELRFNGAALEIVSWTDTQIVAIAPAAPAYGYLSVNKSLVDSNGVLLNVFQPATSTGTTETASAGL